MVLNVVGSNPTSHPKKSSVVERLLRIFLFYMIFLFYGLSTEEKIESEKRDGFSDFWKHWKTSADSILIVALG